VNIYLNSGPVDGHLQDFEKAFTDLLHSRIPLAEQVVRYVAGLKGKRLRPLLVFLTAELHGASTEKSMLSALVIELLHTATLVHDDVVDNSNLRRGMATINHLWDNRISVLIGDLLFARTLSTMLKLEDKKALSILSLATDRITEGELLQIENGGDATIDEAVYMDLIGKKTASLLSASCALGCLSVTQNNEHIERMQQFGENLGIAFQIKDDLLDYTGNAEKMGKPVGNDLREHKITLPLIYALRQAGASERDQVLTLLQQDMLEDTTVHRIVSFAQAHHGLDYANQVAERYARQAVDLIEPYSDSELKTSLRKLIEFAITREN
jgi:octaprenyl-diphosphate synthase